MKPHLNHSAILVIDMQHDFYGIGGNADRRGKQLTNMRAIAGKMDDFLASMRSANAAVFFTQYLYDEAMSPDNLKVKVGPVKGDNYMCRAGTPGAEFDGVTPNEDDTIITKYTYDSFANTQLADILHTAGVTDVLVTGVRSEVCVLATAMRAFAEGFKVFVVEDLVATYDDRKAFQDKLLSSLNKHTATLVCSSELK